MYRYQEQVESENEKALMLHIPASRLFATPYGIFWQVHLKSSSYCEALSFYFCFFMSYITQVWNEDAVFTSTFYTTTCTYPLDFYHRPSKTGMTQSINYIKVLWLSPLHLNVYKLFLDIIFIYNIADMFIFMGSPQFIHLMVVLESGPLRT